MTSGNGVTTTQSVGIVDSVERLNEFLNIVSEDQKIFAKFSQEKVDEIFKEASMAANRVRVELARLAVEEGGMGVVEDKTIKNHFSSDYVYNTYKNMKTCGVVERDEAGGFVKYAEPVGVLGGIVPCTNPTSTTIFKSLLALKTRNCIVFSPHPRTARCTIAAAKVIRDAAVSKGAPANCIGWIDVPTVALCNALMQHPKIVMIVATGATGLVKAAYSSGKPAFGGNSGNTPVLIDESADIAGAVNSVILSKTFDNGMICASEQAIVVVESVAGKVKEEFIRRGAYFLSEAEKEVVGNIILTDKGVLNPAAVGQSAAKLAELAGIKSVPAECQVLVAELTGVGAYEKLSHEKLCPCLGFYVVPDFDCALKRGLELVEYGGLGHTSVLYTDLDGPLKDERISKFQTMMPTGRTLVCMPTSQGAIGNLYNFRQVPSMSLGCGSWGSNMSCECLQAKHLLNYKTVCERRQHIQWFKVPPSVYFNRGILCEAFRELKGFKRALIVSDPGLKTVGHVTVVADSLRGCGIESEVFAEAGDAEVKSLKVGIERMKSYEPDLVVALGGGASMALAKVMRLLYEHPKVSLDSLNTCCLDMLKRVVEFPKLGTKIQKLICIPTTSGTGMEITPFATIYDQDKDICYSLADYSLTPDMAIIDSDFALTMPANLAAHTGFSAFVNAIESYVSMVASDYTRGLSQKAIEGLFKNLKSSVIENNHKARETCHNAASIAAMAFSSSFLGICNSLANQLCKEFNIPHGAACAILVPHVIRFNADEAFSKQGTFPQYVHPMAKKHYCEISDFLRLTKESATEAEKVEALVAAIEGVRDSIQLPSRVRDCCKTKISETSFKAKVAEFALNAFGDQCTSTNPRYPMVSELAKLLSNIY